MTSAQELSQILFEIAMDIRGGLERQAMLKRALQTLVRKLCCLGGLVLARRHNGGASVFEEVFILPRNLRRNPDYAAVQRA